MNSITTTNSNQPTSRRQPVDRATLTKMAQSEIVAATNAGETFTAYDITKRLRVKYPMLDIQHADVRDYAVHSTMRDLLAQGLGYTAEDRQYPDGKAKTYMPVGSVVPGITITKPQPTTLPGQIAWDDGDDDQDDGSGFWGEDDNYLI